MTTNHGYNTPGRGESDWDVPLNENFEQIDTGIEIRGADGDKTEFEPKNGAKYLATDTKRVYLGDGSEWKYFTTLGGIRGEIYIQAEEPDGKEGDLWIDTGSN